MRNHFLFLLISTLTAMFSMAQTRQVSGVITDGTQPVEGATINAKGTTVNALSDAAGRFTLQLPANASVVVVSATGYESQEVIAKSTELTITLKRNIRQLDEVVVVGYGQSQKREVTGAINKVPAREIENQPVQSFESAIQGKAPGVVIENSSGKLGQGIKVRIRGTASISASTQPLYVMDGVPLTTASQSDINNEPTNPLIDLNPNDIESIEILKDAAAAAIYGARAANGVVLITTKKGSRNNKTLIELNTSAGFSNPTMKRGFLNAGEYVQAIRDAARNDGRYEFQNGNPTGYSTEQDAIDDYTNYLETELLDYYSLGTDWRNAEVDVNWEDQQYKENAFSGQLDLSVRGGNERTRFYASGFYSDQESIVIYNKFKRYGGRLNLDHSISPRTSAGINIAVSRSQLDRVSSDAAFSTPGQLMAQIPISPLIDPETNDLNANTLYANGLYDAKYNSDNQVTYRTIGNLFAQHNILPSLFFRSEFGADILNMTQKTFADKRTQDGQGVGRGQFFSSQNVTYNTNNYFSWTPQISESSKLTALLGMSYLQNDLLASAEQGESYPSAAVKNLSGATNIIFGNSTNDRYNFLSYFFRTNVTLSNKFLLGLSIRADGSSRFGPNNRFGYFPAASAGWIISQENFLGGSAINFLKLRASAGLTGNAEIGEHQFRELYTVSNYPNLPGFVPVQLGDPDLKWERTLQYNAGVEFGLFENRLSGELDVYMKHTKDLLLAVNVPATNGYFNNITFENQILQNLGSLENKGIELLLNGRIINDTKFTWTSSFNIGFNKNKIKDINEQIIEGAFVFSRAMEGEPIGVFFMPKFVGVDPANGDALYLDETGKPTADYSVAERMVVGNPNPNFTGGFSNNFTFRNFDANIFFTFVSGNEVYNDAGRFMSSGFGNGFDNQTREIIKAWKNPGDITDVPRTGAFYSTGHRTSSRWLYDGSYIRLRQLSIGYTVKNIRLINSLRFFVMGMNLWTKSNYMSDPELNTLGTQTSTVSNITGGVDFYTIPQPRTVSFGLNVKF